MNDQGTYGIGNTGNNVLLNAPVLDYRPPMPKKYNPSIALIGCGGISEQHLKAYKNAGWNVTVLCDVDRAKAEIAQKKFVPEARIVENWEDLISAEDVDIVDMSVHSHVRDKMFEPFIESKKHILSQKPFVTDISRGIAIVSKASEAGIKLAVNQNGRWAPHYGYIGALIDGGYLGDIQAIRHSVSWDHSWVKGTVYEDIYYLVLYDFGIHWFDLISRFLNGRKVISVYANTSYSAGQDIKPPFLASVIIEFEGGQASIDFNAFTKFGQEDRTIIVGTEGTAHSVGIDLRSQTVSYSCESGFAQPILEGSWFPDGFAGSMGELLCAVEEDREPSNSGADNLNSLRLCFSALKSASLGQVVNPNELGLTLI